MSIFKYASTISVISLFVLFGSVIIQSYLESNKLANLTLLLSNLLYHENSHKSSNVRIAIGFGSCSDLTVNAVEFLNYTDNLNDFNEKNRTSDEIHTEEDFLRSFSYYFSNGAAAERYTPNAELFKSLVKKAKKQKTSRWNLGGNAAVMATRFIKEGADVLLAATMSKKLRTHLIDGLQLTESLSKYEEDDIHLILEYRTGDVFGDFIAPRANRYILHNDKNNPMLKSLELLNMDDFKPNLFVVSGLQMMDNFPFSDSQIRTQRLIKVKEQMTEVPPATLIHFEMASFVEIELLNDLLKNVIPFTNSIGMNEQELDNILEVLEEGRISMSAESNPRVSTTLDQMRKVFRILNKNYLIDQKSQNGRQITRLHVHTLAFQLFMVERKSEWRYTKSAAAKSSLIAHKHVCAADEVNPTNAYLILDKSFSTSATDNDVYEEVKNRPKRIHISERDAVPCWNETIKITNDHKLDVEICISPVLVCRDAKQTAGAGDNISAGGLVVQI